MHLTSNERVDEIRRAVRTAVGRLEGLEKTVVEGYYFDGLSMGRLAELERVSLNRAFIVHRQALRSLRAMLAPFVERLFGLEATCVSSCPICVAPWRDDAEAIIEAKTKDMTWGQIIIRIERATGWRTQSPQILIAHQRKHRTYKPERTLHDSTNVEGGTRAEAQDFDGTEAEPGENREGH